MTNKIKGPILSESQVASINDLKSIEQSTLRVVDTIENSDDFKVDPVWLLEGRIEIEKAFMCLVKSISKGESIAR